MSNVAPGTAAEREALLLCRSVSRFFFIFILLLGLIKNLYTVQPTDRERQNIYSERNKSNKTEICESLTSQHDFNSTYQRTGQPHLAQQQL